MQMIPSDIKFDANATPPQWTDNGEQVIEKGTNIRIKIKGLRSEVDKMYAVGTMKEVICYKHCWLFTLANQILQDYLGPLPS
jgi:DNA-directed RNA polymerase subunit E'/Rpb7